MMMSDDKEKTRRLSLAARPALLETACEPDLLIAMVLANLMSPSLWEFRDRIRRRCAGKGEETSESHERIVMEEIHDYMNKHLFHVSPVEIEEIWGCVDLEEERRRLGAEHVDHAMNVIRRAVETRRELGILTEKQSVLLPLMDSGRFPDYEYSVIDLIEAHRRHLRRKKHKPIGITSCADEAVLSVSLAWAEGHVPLETMILFGSPHHYSTLVQHRGRGYWFNGKREYFDVETWSRVCDPRDPAEVWKTFEARAQGFDRIITPFGVHRFQTSESSISPERLEQTHEALSRFFGAELREITDARKRDIRFVPNPIGDASLQVLDEATDAASARSHLQGLAREHPGSVLELAHYTFRDLWVKHPEAYLEAAARGHLVRKRAERIADRADAVAIVKEIEGEASIFDDPDRITLPDEVLSFDTGTHRDKALLLYTLLLHAPCLSKAEKEAVELIFTEKDSYVRTGDTAISATSLLEHQDIPEPGLLRLPQEPSRAGLTTKA